MVFALALGMILISASIPVSVAGQTATQSNSSTQGTQGLCAKEVVSGVNALLANINSAKAQELAEQSAQFQTEVAGHGYKFVTVAAVASFNSETCKATTLEKLSVDFTLNDEYVTSGTTTVPAGVTVFENPALTGVLNVTLDLSVQGLEFFSGYEATYQVSGVLQPLLETQQYYYEPSFNYNSNCYTYYQYNTAYQCEVSTWSGISGSYGGGGFLVQSGTNVLFQCNAGGTCSSGVYGAWWDWVPSGPAYSFGGSVAVSDYITPLEENMYYVGGTLNQYEAAVIDWTQNWAASTSPLSVGQTAYWSQSEFEIPGPNSGGSAPAALPTFGTATMYYATLCWGTTNSCAYWGNVANIVIRSPADTMVNYCPATGSNVQNILLSSVSSFGTYTQTYNTNCGT